MCSIWCQEVQDSKQLGSKLSYVMLSSSPGFKRYWYTYCYILKGSRRVKGSQGQERSKEAYLSIHCLVRLDQFQPLSVWPSGHDIDDGRLICTQAFHRFLQDFAVTLGVEGVSGNQSRVFLQSWKQNNIHEVIPGTENQCTLHFHG